MPLVVPPGSGASAFHAVQQQPRSLHQGVQSFVACLLWHAVLVEHGIVFVACLIWHAALDEFCTLRYSRHIMLAILADCTHRQFMLTQACNAIELQICVC